MAEAKSRPNNPRPRPRPKPGGMASGGAESRRSHLFFDDQVLRTGAVGASLTGTGVDLLVSQGCRPIGNPYTVTRAEGNVIHELGGRPPFQRLQDLVTTLAEFRFKSRATSSNSCSRAIRSAAISPAEATC